MSTTESTTARPGEAAWQPKLVALDIDGTLLRWVDGTGTTSEALSDKVRDAVRRAYDAGAQVVLSSGRSIHAMTGIADLIGIPDDGADRLWIVAANGAVVSRYPPAEVVHEETFDARAAVQAILERRPNVLVAVENRGVGYRMNRPFPEGELGGDRTITPIEEMVAEPVSRVIIRDPDATPEDFLALGRELGLHGIDYVVGYTAWLDLTPVGVSKASGLSYVCDQLDLEPADVLAIGDGRNDIEMLEWAGRGVAMGNAPEVVQEIADAVTAHVADDGAALELSRWF
ncbi:HAD family hydrolase [Nocardioides sp. NPDC057772]|uniref:HAD family hydrolase n=1 Tax=Nocardioides sp. NPDC057772 TaxID=3346245 RepID=UPI00366BE8B3